MIHTQLTTVAESPAPDAAHTCKIRNAFLILLALAAAGLLQWLLTMLPALTVRLMQQSVSMEFAHASITISQWMSYAVGVASVLGNFAAAWLVSWPRKDESRGWMIRLCLALRVTAGIQLGVTLVSWALLIVPISFPPESIWITTPLFLLNWVLLMLVIGQRLKDLRLNALQIEYYILTAVALVSGQVSSWIAMAFVRASQQSGSHVVPSQLQSFFALMSVFGLAMLSWKIVFYTRAYCATRKCVAATPLDTTITAL